MGPIKTPTRARPVVFDRCAGWLHPAGGDVGVLLLSPWGFEELSMRRAWRMLADRVADAGYPVLRFDYPGTGDSAGEAVDLAGFADAAVTAAEMLRRSAGVQRLVVIGQGLGATVAMLAAERIRPEGAALLAPAMRGRDYLRELSVWGAMVAEAMHLSVEGAAAGSVAGFDVPLTLAEALLATDFNAIEAAPAPKMLVAQRPGRAGEQRLADRCESLGAAVSRCAYEGYDAAAGNPTASKPPVAVIEAVSSWISESFALGEAGAATPLEPAILRGDGYLEEPVQFGEDGRLFGVLCEPVGARVGATVLMLSAGGDAHTGWARTCVDQARALALEGIASLRMDAADVGDSAGPLSGEAPRIYDAQHIDDALTAVDLLEARGFGPVLPLGRCSGAFIGFNAAVRDERIRDVVMVNAQRFVWDRDGKIEMASDQVSHYRKQARSPLKLFMRAMRGEIDMEVAAAKLVGAAWAVIKGALAGHGRKLDTAVKDSFGALRKRGVRLTLLYSRDGEAHRAFTGFFGEDGKRLRKCADMELIYLEEADHGLTPRHARQALLSLVKERALWPPSSAAVAAGDPAARRQNLALGARVGPGAVAAH